VSNYALTQRFKDVVLDSAVRIGDLTVDKVYPVLRAETVDTKYGLSILLTIRESDDHCVEVFLPRRYSLWFSEEDVSVVNERTVNYRLIHKGLRSTSRACILKIESDGD
jgi:hypothetical protein